MHKIRVESFDPGHSRICVDDKPIQATKIDVHMEVDCVSEADITLRGEPEMEVEGLVTYNFTPKTVKCAVEVLKAALIKDDFVAFMGMNDLMKVMEKKNG